MDSPVLISTLLFFAVFLAFLPSLGNGFVGYDDPEYVTGNSYVRGGLQNASWAFTSTAAGNWHPLTWLSHMLDCELFGLNPGGHHFTSILLHAGSTVLLFLVLRRNTNASWPSAIAAAIFGLHPLRVESVAWVAERKDVLCAFFWLAALWTYSNYVHAQRKGSTGATTLTRNWYIVTLILFLLGALSKPMIVTFPFALLILDFWPFKRLLNPGASGNLPRINPRVLIEKLPFIAGSLGVAVMTYSAQSKAGAVLTDISLPARLLHIPLSYLQYIGKFLWPMRLAVFYPREPSPISLTVGALLLLIVICAALWFQRKSRPWLLSGFAWFLLVLAPVIGLVQAGEQSIADRYTYLPSIGLIILLVWGGDELARRIHFRHAGCIGIAIAILFGALTFRQTRFWKDSTSLFEHAAKVTKDNYLAHNNLGVVLDHEGRPAEARILFETALRENPAYSDAHNNLGIALAKLGLGELAMQHYLESIRLKPHYADPHNNLGLLLERLGRPAEAADQYVAAIRMRPDFAEAHYNLGITLAGAHRFDEAIAQFTEFLKYRPDSADAHNNMGVAFDQKGDTGAAIREYMAALTLKPDYTRAHYNLGVALAREGKLDAAVAQFEEALKLEPNYVEARKNLESILKARQSSPRQ